MPLGNWPASARPTTSSQRSSGWRCALGGLLGDQLAARRDGAVLGGVLQRVRADRLGRRRAGRTVRQPIGGLAGLDAADEALQPLLLLVVEFAHAAAWLPASRPPGPGAVLVSRGSPAPRGIAVVVADGRAAPCACAAAAGRPSMILPIVAFGPLVIITTRSASRIASSTSWVTQIAVTWVRCPDLHQHFLQLPARQAVEHAERLVEQQQLGRQREGARDADALLHAVGEFARPACAWHRRGRRARGSIRRCRAARPAWRGDRPGRRRARRSRAP